MLLGSSPKLRVKPSGVREPVPVNSGDMKRAFASLTASRRCLTFSLRSRAPACCLNVASTRSCSAMARVTPDCPRNSVPCLNCLRSSAVSVCRRSSSSRSMEIRSRTSCKSLRIFTEDDGSPLFRVALVRLCIPSSSSSLAVVLCMSVPSCVNSCDPPLVACCSSMSAVRWRRSASVLFVIAPYWAASVTR